MSGNESSLMAAYDDPVASLGGSIIVTRSRLYCASELHCPPRKAWWSWMKLHTAGRWGRCGRCGISKGSGCHYLWL